MKILLDENMPHGLLAPLRQLGHTAESVGTLRLKGLDNSRLYREVAQSYDLFFTRDREFAAHLEFAQVRAAAAAAGDIFTALLGDALNQSG